MGQCLSKGDGIKKPTLEPASTKNKGKRGDGISIMESNFYPPCKTQTKMHLSKAKQSRLNKKRDPEPILKNAKASKSRGRDVDAHLPASPCLIPAQCKNASGFLRSLSVLSFLLVVQFVPSRYEKERGMQNGLQLKARKDGYPASKQADKPGNVEIAVA